MILRAIHVAAIFLCFDYCLYLIVLAMSERGEKFINRISVLLIPALMVLTAGVLIFMLLSRDKGDDFKFELVKYLIQFSLIVIVGGILIQEYNRRRDKAKAINEFRKTLLANMTRAYLNTKRARRILKAHIIPTEGTGRHGIAYTVYVEQIEVINEAQLEFEFYKRQLKTYYHAFSKDNLRKLRNMASTMEKHLNEFVKEYENLKVSADAAKPISMSRLPMLAAFTEKGGADSFSNLFHSSAKIIQTELLHM